MEKRRNRYKEMERYLTYALLADAALFVVYLLVAGLGIAWFKVTLAILAIVISGLALAYLYMTGELLKLRSRWLSVGFGAIALVIFVSLLLNYPSPDPLKQLLPGGSIDTTLPISTMIRGALQI